MEKVMAKYEVRDVVCDHGLYEDSELRLILNSAKNAHMIKRILEIDSSVPNTATIADVVEVVRCKDCRYFDVIIDCCTNELGMHSCCADGFCSYGERKE